jgi:hypothetical protein
MAFDEPEEHWAPPDSLDPTPVWKQYLLVVLLGVAVLAFGVVYAYLAWLPDAVTPPAALPGRVILPALQYPRGTTQRVAVPGADATFYLTYAGADPVAIRATWSPQLGGAPCDVLLAAEAGPGAAVPEGGEFRASCSDSVFDARGERLSGSAPRGLDRYLVSRKGDRLIVNTDHVIQGTP